MSIVVIDMSPELFWYVSNALLPLNIPMKHLPDAKQAINIICSDLPSVVILNNDDPNIKSIEMIGHLRNHIFARNILFIVFSSSQEIEHRRQLAIAGAGQVFYKKGQQLPSSKYFFNCMKWLLDHKNKESISFEIEKNPVEEVTDIFSFGRIGYVTETKMLIESNLDLNVGDIIDINTTIFDDLAIKNVKFICMEKNTVGRYYQYENSFLGRFESKNTSSDMKKIAAWIKTNANNSKHKSVKIIFFEEDTEYRNELAKTIKSDQNFCARGFKDLKNFEEVLNYQKPHLILINRDLISKYKNKFEAIKKYLKNNFCHCITYAHNTFIDIEEYKKNYSFAMHVENPINVSLLESMIDKLNQKIPKLDTEELKFTPSKKSSYSKIKFHLKGSITNISSDTLTINSPVLLTPFCSIELDSTYLSAIRLGRTQLFKVLDYKKSKVGDGYPHQLLFFCQTHKEKEHLIQAISDLKNAPKESQKA